MNFLLIAYFISVILIGVSYVYHSKGLNLKLVLSYIDGNRDLNVVALIYTSIYEMMFEMISIFGSGFCIYILVKKSKFKTKNKVLLLIHMLTTLVYLVRNITLVQGIVHIATQGTIKNTEVWDFKKIMNELIGEKNIMFNMIFFLVGIVLILAIQYNDKIKNKKTSLNAPITLYQSVAEKN